MKSILIISIIVSSLFGNLPEAQYRLKMKTINKRECKRLNNYSICYIVSMRYPYTDIIKRDISKIIKSSVSNVKKELFKENIEEVVSDISDNDLFEDTTWFNKSVIELFDYYKGFTTISIFNEQYTGGAHSNSGLSLFTYKDSIDRALNLKDIIGSGNLNRFYSTAQKAYKLDRGLLPNEPLTKDDWFEDDFKLSKNFAITQKGILFVYSPYEIKAYALGYTHFTIPYSMLKNVVGKDSIIYDIVNRSRAEVGYKKINIEFNHNGYLRASLKALGNRRVELDVDMELYSRYRYLWLSIGLPQYRSARGVSIVDYSGFDRFSLYRAGSKIFNISKRGVMRARYLLIEGEKRNFSADRASAKLILKAPKYSDTLCVELRVTAKNRKIESFIYSSFIDQQGFNSKRLCIQVK